MSADNFIAVQRRGRKWHVWMAFASSPEPHTPYGAGHRTFDDVQDAIDYATEFYDDLPIVEYGVVCPENIGIWTDIWQRIRYYF